MYLAIKHLHVTAVTLSLSFFALRGYWMLTGSPLLGRTWVRRLPHVVDTVLLLSAITLASLLRQYPFVHPWLTAKVLALVAYVVLGSLALHRGRTPAIRRTALALALLTAAYIVAVALQHDPLPWRQLLAG